MQTVTKRLAVWAAIVAAFLTIPLIAMQFSNEITWTRFDFILMGTLLFVAGTTFELISRKINDRSHRVIAGIVIATIVLLIWVHGAVGIIGD